jgi:uncharacterized protein (TIGR03437 family)
MTLTRIAFRTAFFALGLCQLALPATRYALILDDPAPAAATGRTGRLQVRALSDRLTPAHEDVKARLQVRGVRVTGEAKTLLNAIFVDVEPDAVAELSTIPGVRYAAPVRRVKLMLDRATQLINTPAAWSFFGGLTNAGSGMRIAIIDTGIQSTHPAFQDPTLSAPAGYPICSIYQQPLTPLDCTQFTNSKVIVARSYVPLLAAGSGSAPAANSHPDDLTPRDHVGHGTAVAMAAAGNTAVGATATITGVAPKAFLGSYKVFGSPGLIDFTGSDAVINALEDAFNDGMDVAELSLGAPALSGPQDTGATCGLSAGSACDVFAAAVENAIAAGMIVVAAAGNEGSTGSVAQPTLATVSTPGDTPGVITVGASTNGHDFSNDLTVNGLGTFKSQSGGSITPPSALPGRLADAGSVGDPLACSPYPAASLTNIVAVIARGTCTFATKVQNAQAAGAVGAIVSNTTGDNTLVAMGGLGSVNIPATFIGYDDGQTIRTFLQNNSNVTATIDPVRREFDVSTVNQMATFSSRGPVLGSGAVKPDVVAAGTSLYLAGETYDPSGALYGADGFAISQGTSFSAPQIAGLAALVKQANPSFSVADVKSAIVNTATQDVTDNGLAASVLAVGAGKASAGAAVRSNIVVAPVSGSLGILRSGTPSSSQVFTLKNAGSSRVTLNMQLAKNTPETGAQVSLSPASLSLPPGQSGTFTLSLTGSTPAAGIYEGGVNVTGGASPIWIPWVYVQPSGLPYNIIPVIGDGDEGFTGKLSSIGYLVLQVIDKQGVPVPSVPVRFSPVSGGGRVSNSDLSTDAYGLAAAQPILGVVPGTNSYIATAGGLSTAFSITGYGLPTVNTGGAVNAASFQAGATPGSYLALFGSSLANGNSIVKTPNLPVSMGGVSVSFDAPQISVPGHLHFATPAQVNVQIPWELAGQSSAQVKVSIDGNAGALFTLPLVKYAPAVFEYSAGTQRFAAARDENFQLIGPSNPARQGHVIQLYANGLGPVNNQPASGDPTPASPFATTATNPTVTIGSLDAPVQFSGLAPTLVGVYQLNVTVPNTGAGTQAVVINIGGVTGKASSIVVQ